MSADDKLFMSLLTCSTPACSSNSLDSLPSLPVSLRLAWLLVSPFSLASGSFFHRTLFFFLEPFHTNPMFLLPHAKPSDVLVSLAMQAPLFASSSSSSLSFCCRSRSFFFFFFARLEFATAFFLLCFGFLLGEF